MINCVSNCIDQKRIFTKHVSYPSRKLKEKNTKSKKHLFPQKKPLNSSEQKMYNNNVNFTQRALFSKHNFINDLTKHSQSSINPRSPKLDTKSQNQTKTSNHHTPTKSLEAFISLTVQYNSRTFYLNVTKKDDGLSLASKLDIALSLRLEDSELEALGIDLTKHINLIIDTLQVTNQHNISNHSRSNRIINRNINGFVIDLNEILLRSSKIKIMIKYGKMIFNYYITNNRDEINDVIEDILFTISNDSHKYDNVTLKEKIKLSINEAIENTLKRK